MQRRRCEQGRISVRHTLDPTTAWRRKARGARRRARHKRQRRAPAARCVGCEEIAAPGRRERQDGQSERWGNRRRRSRRSGAATAIEWRSVRREPRAVVRSTLPEAKAAVSAVMRTPVYGAVRSEVRACSAGAPARVRRVLRRVVREPVRGEAGTGRRTGAPGPKPRRCPQPAQPARASEARSATSVARSAGGGGPARGGERSEPPGKRSAQ